VVLKPFEERKYRKDLSGNAVTGRLMGQFTQIQEGLALVFPPPPVRGVGTAGGFKMQVEDRTGRASPQELQGVIEAVMAKARQNHDLQQVFSTFRANVPQLYANVDKT